MLQGSVSEREGQVRLAARLTDTSTGDIAWSVSDTIEEGSSSGFEIEDNWAAQIAAELGDYAGVVFRRTAGIPGLPTDTHAFAAKLAFQAYVEGGNPDTLLAAEQALATAMAAGIRTPAILAMRGTTLAVRATYGSLRDVEANLSAAEQVAREACPPNPPTGMPMWCWEPSPSPGTNGTWPAATPRMPPGAALVIPPFWRRLGR